MSNYALDCFGLRTIDAIWSSACILLNQGIDACVHRVIVFLRHSASRINAQYRCNGMLRPLAYKWL